MRKVSLAMMSLAFAGLGYSQTYTETWRAITAPTQTNEFIQWDRITTTATNEVVVLGTVTNGEPPPSGPSVLDQTRTIIVAKFAANGTPLWSTRDFTGPADTISTIDLEVDAAGNAYVSYRTGIGFGEITSYASATGAERWSVPIAMNSEEDRPIKLAVRSAGNSTFVYAGLTVVANNLPAFELRRLNSATGAATQTLPVSGTTRAVLNSLKTDLNGNILFGAGIDNDAIIRKLNQSFTQVFNVAIPESSSAELALNTTSNTALAFTLAKLNGVNRLTVLNATNGSVVVQKVLEKDQRFAELQPNVFGSWWSNGRIGEKGAAIGLTPGLSIYASDSPSKGTRGLVTDISGQVHFPTIGATPFKFAVRRAPAVTVFEAAGLSDGGVTAVATDSLGHVIAAGLTLNGDGVVIQLDQQFLANTDVIVRDFTGPLTVEAPGVLANDTNWVGGTLSIFTQPTEGTVVLNQDGSFTYTPGANYDGTDQFQYRVTKNGVPRTATCVVKQLVITGITLPATIIGEDSASGNLTINNGGFPDEFVPNMSFSSTNVSLQFIQPFAPGETSTLFSIKSKPVNTNEVVTVTASASGQTRTATITVKVGGIKSITTVGNAPLIVGETSSVVFRLTGVVQAARSYNISREGMAGPAQVTIPAGSDNVVFSVQPNVAAGQTAKIIIFTSNGPQEFLFPVQAKPVLQALALFDPILYAGTTFRVKATLDGKAGTAGVSVPVTDNSSQVVLAANANVPAGASAGAANGTANLAAANTTVTFSGTFGNVSKSFNALVRNNLLESFTVSPAVLTKRQTSVATVSLNWIAQGSGQTVGISTDHPELVTMPTKIVIPAGQTVGHFNIVAGNGSGSFTVAVTVGQKKLSRDMVITP